LNIFHGAGGSGAEMGLREKGKFIFPMIKMDRKIEVSELQKISLDGIDTRYYDYDK